MKHAIINLNGAIELRIDSFNTVPEGAIVISDDEYDKLMSGELIIENGKVVVNQSYVEKIL